MLDPNSSEECLVVALKILQRAMQTVAQMRQKLERRGFEPLVVDKTIIKLERMGLLDDAKYAADYISYRTRNAPLGSYSLRLKLRQKGISKVVVEEATRDISPESELEWARALAGKKLKTIAKYSTQEQKTKLAQFLISRGFAGSTVYAIIKVIFSA